MFNNDVKRIGFACKYFHPDRTLKKKILEERRDTSTGRFRTTVVHKISLEALGAAGELEV